MPPHPRLQARGTPRYPHTSAEILRVIVYAPEPDREEWIASELENQKVLVHMARSIASVVETLVEDPPPRPQILIADFDAMTAGELLHLHSVRELGWFGQVIALGCVPVTLRLSMRIDRVLNTPFPRNTLRAIVAHASQPGGCTLKMPKIIG